MIYLFFNKCLNAVFNSSFVIKIEFNNILELQNALTD